MNRSKKLKGLAAQRAKEQAELDATVARCSNADSQFSRNPEAEFGPSEIHLEPIIGGICEIYDENAVDEDGNPRDSVPALKFEITIA
jgi:hypothetical protein